VTATTPLHFTLKKSHKIFNMFVMSVGIDYTTLFTNSVIYTMLGRYFFIKLSNQENIMNSFNKSLLLGGSSLLGYDGLSLGKWFLTFERNILPPY